VNPDVEIAEFLARHGAFGNVPRLLATIRFHDAGRFDDGGPGCFSSTWQSRRRLGLSRSRARARKAIEERPAAPNETFAAAAARLGAITRRLHEALARTRRIRSSRRCPSAPKNSPLGRAGSHASEARAKPSPRAVRPATSQPALEPSPRCLRAACPRRWRGFRASPLRSARRAGRRSGTHGDYHLGQVLVTRRDDFRDPDFEGEPTRPLRRAAASATARCATWPECCARSPMRPRGGP